MAAPTAIDLEIAELLSNWQRNAEQAVRICRLLETQLLQAEARANELADEVHTLRNKLRGVVATQPEAKA